MSNYYTHECSNSLKNVYTAARFSELLRLLNHDKNETHNNSALESGIEDGEEEEAWRYF